MCRRRLRDDSTIKRWVGIRDDSTIKRWVGIWGLDELKSKPPKGGYIGVNIRKEYGAYADTYSLDPYIRVQVPSNHILTQNLY